ncbi:hypothetical protein GUJ93_ZPchr0001g30955 [Zizania palustris]|uniref:Uncharacterized protein n=1 Tax=Zizania palustris TaxID=103762 RepID=A0A8J5S8W2_ZIZPA|nr:hypothetical protein GUJ93_ZPchr0001g30955 [Zizania palustris]
MMARHSATGATVTHLWGVDATWLWGTCMALCMHVAVTAGVKEGNTHLGTINGHMRQWHDIRALCCGDWAACYAQSSMHLEHVVRLTHHHAMWLYAGAMRGIDLVSSRPNDRARS